MCYIIVTAPPVIFPIAIRSNIFSTSKGPIKGESYASRINGSRSSSGTTNFQIFLQFNTRSRSALVCYSYSRPSSIFQLLYFLGFLVTFIGILTYQPSRFATSAEKLATVTISSASYMSDSASGKRCSAPLRCKTLMSHCCISRAERANRPLLSSNVLSHLNGCDPLSPQNDHLLRRRTTSCLAKQWPGIQAR